MPLNTHLQQFPRWYQAAFQRMVADYARLFGGRVAELAALDAFVDQAHQPYALLLAPTGRGKTALLIHWLQQRPQRDHAVIVFVAISRRYQTASAQGALTALATALAGIHGESLHGTHAAPDQLRPLIADYLRRDLPPGQRALLIIDGMDEAVGWQVTRELFPVRPGRGMQVLGAARHLANTSAADWLAQLGWPADAVRLLALPPLSASAIAQLLEAAGLAHLGALAPQLTRISEGDPLTLRLLLEAIQQGLLAPDQLTRQPPGLERHLREWLADLERHADQVPIRLLLDLCATAFGPLTCADISALAPEVFASDDVIHQAAVAVGRFILGDGSAERGYVFSHPRLRETYQERVLAEAERRALQQRFITYGQRWWTLNAGPLPDYLRQFWIAHLAAASAWDRMAAVLTATTAHNDGRHQRWAAARYAVEGSYSGYLADLDALWRHAEARRDLALGLRCALIAGSIRSMSAHLTPDLLVQLVLVGTPAGRWSIAAALEHCRLADRDGYLLEALIGAVPGLPVEPVLDLIRTLSAENQARVLSTYAPHVPEPQRTQFVVEALELHSRIVTERAAWAAEMLPTLVDVLAPARLHQLIILIAGRTASYQGGDRTVAILARLLARLPESVVAQAFAAAAALEHERDREQAVVGLARAGQPGLVAPAFQVVVEIRNEHHQAEGIAALAALLPEPLIRAAFEHTQAMRDQRYRKSIIWSLAARLPPDLVQQAFAMACAGDDDLRAEILPALAPRLDIAQLWRALNVLWALDKSEQRDRALARLTPFLSALNLKLPLRLIAEQPTVMDRFVSLLELRAQVDGAQVAQVDHALAALFANPAHAVECVPLFNLLPIYAPPEAPLPQDLIDLLWQSIRGAFHALTHPQLVGALVRYPPHAQRQELYGELVDALYARDDEFILRSGLAPVIPHLPLERQEALLERIGAMRLEHTAPRMLISLAEVVSPALRTRAIDLARAFAARSRSRSTIDLLVSLAHHLPPEERPGVYQEALQLAQTIQDRNAALMALLALLPLVSPARRRQLSEQLRALPAALRSVMDARTALDLMERLPALARRQVQQAVLEAGAADPEILAGSLGYLTGRTRAAVADSLMKHLVDAPPDEYAASRAGQQLIAVIPLLPRRLLGAAERAARHQQDAHRRAQILALLAQRSRGRHRRGLYAEALASIRAHPKPYAGFDLLGCLPPEPAAELAHAILQDMLAGERQPNPRLFSRLAPHLSPAGMTALVQRAAASPYAEERVDAWLELAPYLPADQQAQAYRAIFTHVPAIWAMGDYARLLALLVPHLPVDLLPQALEAARAIAGKPTHEDRSPGAADHEQDQRYDLLGEALLAILVRLPAEEQPAIAEECIRAAQRTTASYRARALLRLLPHLAPERQAAIALEALTAITAPTRSMWGRSQVLGELVPWLVRASSVGMLAASDLCAHWQRTVRGFSPAGRAELFDMLVAGAPWLATLASRADMNAISGSVTEAVECWP